MSSTMRSSVTSILVPSSEESEATVIEVPTRVLSQARLFSSALQAVNPLTLPKAITVPEFQQWIDASLSRGIESTLPELMGGSLFSFCKVLKVADVLNDCDLDYWVDKVLAAFEFGPLSSKHPHGRTMSKSLETFCSLPEHLQHMVFKAAAMDKNHSMNHLPSFLYMLPEHLHPLVLCEYISPDNCLILPTIYPSVMVPFLYASKHLHCARQQIDSLFEPASFPTAPPTANPTAQGQLTLYDSPKPPDMQQAAVAVALSSALRHHSRLRCLCLKSLVHHAPAAALQRLPSAIATLTCLRVLILGSVHSPVAPEFLMYLESMLLPLVHLRTLKLRVDITPAQPEQSYFQTIGQPGPGSSSSAGECRLPHGKRKASAPEISTSMSPLSLLIRGLAAAQTVSDLLVVPIDNSSSDAPGQSLQEPGRPSKATKASDRVDSQQHSANPDFCIQAPFFQRMSTCSMMGRLQSRLIHSMMHGLNPPLLTDLTILSERRLEDSARLKNPASVFARMKQCQQLVHLQLVMFGDQENGFAPALSSSLASMSNLESLLLSLRADYVQKCLPAAATAATRITKLSLVCFVAESTELAEVAWGEMCEHINKLPLKYLILGGLPMTKVYPEPEFEVAHNGTFSSSEAGLSALSGLTELKHLGLKGWATAFRSHKDCKVIREMQQLERVCLDVGPRHHAHADFVPALSSLPNLSEVMLEVVCGETEHLLIDGEDNGFVSRFAGHRLPNAWPALQQLCVSVDRFSDACIVASRASRIPNLESLHIGRGFAPGPEIFSDEGCEELAVRAQNVPVHVYGEDVAPLGIGRWAHRLWPPSLWAAAADV